MSTSDRLHALDAVRAFALLLGVVFHAGFSFIPGMIPGIWAFNDNSPSVAISVLLFTSHIFRMSLFFFIAGFFARMMFERKGARGFWSNRSTRILVPLIAGWVVIFPALAAVWVWGLTKTFGGALPAAPANAPAPPPWAFPLTHLWFLYYLLVLYAIVLVCRTIVVRLDRSGSHPWFRGRRDPRRHPQRDRGGGARDAVHPGALLPRRLGRSGSAFRHPTARSSPSSPRSSASALPSPSDGSCTGKSICSRSGRSSGRLHLAVALGATAVCVWIAGSTPSFVPASARPREARIRVLLQPCDLVLELRG